MILIWWFQLPLTVMFFPQIFSTIRRILNQPARCSCRFRKFLAACLDEQITGVQKWIASKNNQYLLLAKVSKLTYWIGGLYSWNLTLAPPRVEDSLRLIGIKRNELHDRSGICLITEPDFFTLCHNKETKSYNSYSLKISKLYANDHCKNSDKILKSEVSINSVYESQEWKIKNAARLPLVPFG